MPPLFDLEDRAQDFVLETKQILIPGHPFAFNPSIVRWQGRLMMSFRVIDDPKKSFESWIGLVLLDDDLNPISIPQRLAMRSPDSTIPCRAEDARLITVGDRLWMVYSDNAEPKVSRGGFRVYIAEVIGSNDDFSLQNIECLTQFEGVDPNLREKNWVPLTIKASFCLPTASNRTVF